MTPPNEQYALFTVTGDFDPARITTRVGVVPTRSWAKGTADRFGIKKKKTSGWSLYSRIGRTEPLEAHVEDVLAQMRVNAGEFRAVAAEFAGRMQLVGMFYGGYPGLRLEPEQVTGLAEFGLEVDFDFYDMDVDRMGRDFPDAG